MKYQTAKAIWFPTQSAAYFVKSRSYTESIGLYGPSGRYVQFAKQTGKSNTNFGNLVIVTKNNYNIGQSNVNKKLNYIVTIPPTRG